LGKENFSTFYFNILLRFILPEVMHHLLRPYSALPFCM